MARDFEVLDYGSMFKEPLGVLAKKPVVLLGRRLFFDKKLSKDSTISCADCHRPAFGFSDPRVLSVGIHGKKTKRHSQQLLNLAWGREMFWDGRARNLEEQVLIPIESPEEMGISMDDLLIRLNENKKYKAEFKKVFGIKKIKKVHVKKALARFVESLVSYDSKFDRYLGGDKKALSSLEKKGMKLFKGKGKCITCHFGPNLTDDEFHFTGVLGDDIGRAGVDRNGRKEFNIVPYPFFAAKRAFKTPSLRNVSKTFPYMHNGSEATLDSVIEHYNMGGRAQDKQGLARGIQKLNLTDHEKKALKAFLKTLTGKINFPKDVD